MVNLEEIQEIFFEAMKAGWASSTIKTSIVALPGYKAVVWENGAWRVVDFYAVGPEIQKGAKSVGTTIIFYEDKPVWLMSYGGYYLKEDIPFLKRALSQAYFRHDFVGGRGPVRYEEEELHRLYCNEVRENSFGKFKGEEKIMDNARGYIIGRHEYWGMALF